MFRKLTAVLTALVLMLTSCGVLAESADASPDIRGLPAGTDKNIPFHQENGKLTFVGGSITADPVRNTADAMRVVKEALPAVGGNQDTAFELWRVMKDTVGNIYYIFQQVQNGCLVLGGSAKIITDPAGNMLGMTCSVIPAENSGDISDGESISGKQAEEIVMDHALKDGPAVTLVEGLTMKVVQPVDREPDLTADVIESRYVWVVYTSNPSASLSGVDLPYLAHYVTMDGTYLYSLPTIIPGDAAGAAGYPSRYVFEFMEPVDYTGYVDFSDGTEHEISVTLMRDTRTGMYYLGNIERQIIVADCWNFLYNGGRVVLEYSPDNLEWDQTSLLSLYNYCKVWDFFSEIGWRGSDGAETPMIILKDFCDEHHNPVDNAAYAGRIYGYEAFLSSSVNNMAQCLDVCAHEFTHCVTATATTYNSYMNDYGAINEGISDILGNICEMMTAPTGDTGWEIAESATPVRSMSDPHKYQQPEYVWDIYYRAQVKDPTDTNDRGGVHSNSSLLSRIAYLLCTEGGMPLQDARAFWFAADCAMVPASDYAQLRVLLPWVLHITGLDAYRSTLEKALQETRLGEKRMPDTIGGDRALLELDLPDNEVFNNGKWALQIISLNVENLVSLVHQIKEDILSGSLEGYPSAIREIFAPAPKEETEDSGGLLDLLFSLSGEEAADHEKKPEQEAADREAAVKEAADRKELLDWANAKLQETLYLDMGSAGPDGHVIRAMSQPGRTLPVLLYLSADPGGAKIERMKIVLYLNGRWYDVTASLPDPGKDGESEFGDLLSSVVSSDFAADVLRLLGESADLSAVANAFTLNVEGGATVRISAEGLDKITLDAGIRNLNLSGGEELNNRKSRPKIPEEE